MIRTVMTTVWVSMLATVGLAGTAAADEDDNPCPLVPDTLPEITSCVQHYTHVALDQANWAIGEAENQYVQARWTVCITIYGDPSRFPPECNEDPF